MKSLRLLLLALAMGAVSFLAGARWTSQAPATASAAAPRTVVRYTCPMHPAYHSDRPGDCPSCGMRLEPVYAERPGGAPTPGTSPAGARLVHVSAQRQQVIGVRLGMVESITGMQTLRTTGRVVPDENAVYPLVAGAEGWVRKLHGATTGSLVRKNEVLLSFYSPEIVVAQQSYYSGLDTLGRVSSEQLRAFNETRVVEGVERYANTLRNLGVSETQLEEMRTHRRLTEEVHVLAPVDGFVLQRNASAGLRFDRGFEFYRVADLRRVWILADVYENQLPFIRRGSPARIASRDQNRTFEGHVSQTEPTFDDATRTLKVRLETANPGFALKPGMFVDVEFAVELPVTLAVPADAVVDSGLRKTVFVDKGDGYFEPRRVETGWRMGDRLQITKGLMPGDRVVVSGNFLLDSESRMKSAAAGMYHPETDPVCGMDVDHDAARNAGRTVAHLNSTYYFCSEDCKRKFEAQPARYVEAGPEHGAPLPSQVPPARARAPRHAPAMSKASTESMSRAVPIPATARDPVCGMDVNTKDALAAGRTQHHEGRAYYFCSDDCKKSFRANPGKYLKSDGETRHD